MALPRCWLYLNQGDRLCPPHYFTPPPQIFQTLLRPFTQCHDWPSIKVDLVSNWLGLDVISKVITLSFSRSVPATRTIVLSVCLCHRSLLRREIESRESRYGYTVITCEQTFDHPHTNTQWVHINSEEEHFAEFSFKFQYMYYFSKVQKF